MERPASSATATWTTRDAFDGGVRASCTRRSASAVRDGLGATVYTQLSDVEDELNGLLTWDREVLKIDPDVVRRVTAALALRANSLEQWTVTTRPPSRAPAWAWS